MSSFSHYLLQKSIFFAAVVEIPLIFFLVFSIEVIKISPHASLPVLCLWFSQFPGVIFAMVISQLRELIPNSLFVIVYWSVVLVTQLGMLTLVSYLMLDASSKKS